MAGENFISQRYLQNRGKYGFFAFTVRLSVTGIALGVAALVIVMAVMNGFTGELKNRILAVNAHAVILRYAGEFRDFEALQVKLAGFAAVRAAVPFVYNQAMLTSAGGAKGAVIRGMRAADLFAVGELEEQLRRGGGVAPAAELFRPRFDEETKNDLPAIVLGAVLAEKLKVRRGDVVNVVSPTGDNTLFNVAPRLKRFYVSAVFSSGFYEYDNSLAYMDLEEAQRFFHMEGVITGLELRLTDAEKAAETTDAIEAALGYPYWVRHWQELNRNLFSALAVEKYVMFLLLCIIIGVASFNMISSTIMLVVEKRQEIGILMAMGMPRRSVGGVFMRLGAAVGLLGTLGGALLGVAICLAVDRFGLVSLPADVYFISSFPIKPDLPSVLLVAATGVLITSVFTVIPARLAARTMPAEALRYE